MLFEPCCLVLFYLCTLLVSFCIFFFFNDTATTEIYTLSLHDALPILPARHGDDVADRERLVHCAFDLDPCRSEEHTSELQSPCNLVCRLLLEKKKKKLRLCRRGMRSVRRLRALPDAVITTLVTKRSAS